MLRAFHISAQVILKIRKVPFFYHPTSCGMWEFEQLNNIIYVTQGYIACTGESRVCVQAVLTAESTQLSS